MKHALLFIFLILGGPAWASSHTIAMDDARTNFAAGVGKLVTLTFSPSLAASYFPKTTYANLTLTEVNATQVCFNGFDAGLDQNAASFKAIARTDDNDLCVHRHDVSVTYEADDVAGAPPQPFFQTDSKSCKWVWRTGKGIGIWAEDCDFDTGLYAVTYDEAKDSFVMAASGTDPFPVLRQFHKAAGEGPDVLLPQLKAAKLIPDDDECHFAPTSPSQDFGTWTTYDIVPTGKRKEAYEAQPSDEIPDPPCGEVGLAVDFVGYFMIDSNHPDRVIYVNLGQDGTFFDPYSIQLF